MNKQNNGFTLVELLAVIAILGILALIVTPKIVNVISESQVKAEQRSVDGLKHAIEIAVGEIMLDDDYARGQIKCKLGSKMSDTEKGNVSQLNEEETYCWDKNKPKETIMQVSYGGTRVKADEISVDMETGEVAIKDAQVGDSSNKYSIGEIAVRLEDTIEDLATEANKEWIFTDDYGNIRYRGKNPNNYVKFNDETWRIIGIVDGYVKIIRDESIGNYSWDYSEINDWIQSDLMKLLNPGYDNEQIGGSLYWNGKNGKCYGNTLNDSIASEMNCDFDGVGNHAKGLSEEARDMIQKTTWSLGGWSTPKVTTQTMFDKEHGNTVYSGRPTEFTGNVGLMYPSDYGYAASESSISNTNLYDYDDSTCVSNNWLFKNNDQYVWLLSSKSDDSRWVFYIYSTGYVESENSYIAKAVRPVVHLKSSVKITGGTGKADDMYILG